MIIEILQKDFAGHIDVTTHVEIDRQIYRESTEVLMTNLNSSPKALGLEILECVKIHTTRIQKMILREIKFNNRLTQTEQKTHPAD